MKKNRARFICAILLFFCLGFTTMNYNTISAEETTSTKLDSNADVAYIEISVNSGDKTDTNTFTYKVESKNQNLGFETDVLLKGNTSKKIEVPTGTAYTIKEISNGNFDTKTNKYETDVLVKQKIEKIIFTSVKKSKLIHEGAVTNVLSSIDVDVSFGYYEKYSDGTYGFHIKDKSTTIVEDKVIIEDGYCLYDTEALEDFLKDNKHVKVSVTLGESDKDILDLDYGKVPTNKPYNEVNFIKLKNITAEDEFVKLQGDESAPVRVHVNLLNLKYQGESRSICEDTWYNPLFSDTIYFDSNETIAQSQFNIRTPRNLDNIDRVNEDYKNIDGSNGILHSNGITYTQTKDLNFADFTATSDTSRYYKDGFLINDAGASINPNSTGAIVINTFNGNEYNGNGKKIMNLTINGNSTNTKGVTIFEYNNKIIKNCTVENATLTKTDEGDFNGVSALVGRNLYGAIVSESKLTGLVNMKSEKKTPVATGGLVATNESGSSIENCEVKTLKDSVINGYSSVGGIVGRSLGNAKVITSKIAQEAILTVSGVDDGKKIGGIVGENNGLIDGSSIEGRITINGHSSIGGIAGQSLGDAQVKNSNIDKGAFLTISGTVDANDVPIGNYFGGIVGDNHGAIAVGSVEGELVIKGNNAGGIAGLNGYEDKLNSETIIISDCIVSGSVTVNGENIGGIVGRNNGLIFSCEVNGILTIDATGYENAGGIAGNNTKYIEKCTLGGQGSDTIHIKGTSHVGGIAGNNGSSEVSTVAKITESKVDGQSIIIESTGSFVGGIAGWNYGEIRQSKVLGTTGIKGKSHAGGITGVNGDDAYNKTDPQKLLPRALIANCEVTENVAISTSEQYAGGLVGYNNADIGNPLEEEDDRVNRVTGQVKISAGSNYAGGIAGYNNSLGIITGKSDNFPILVQGDESGINIVAKFNAGGIAGINHAGRSNDIGDPVYGNALINFSKVDGQTKIGDESPGICIGRVGGIAGINTYDSIDITPSDNKEEFTYFEAEIKNSTVGSTSNYIKVSSFYVDFVHTIAQKFDEGKADENNEDKKVFGWVKKIGSASLDGVDTTYPPTN